MSASDAMMWVEQPQKRLTRSSNGGGSLAVDYLADHGRGRETATMKGYLEGRQMLIDGETWEVSNIAVADEGEGAYDRVTITYTSMYGAPTPSRSQKQHKSGDEEWRMHVEMKAMTANEALDKGYIASISDVSLINDDADATIINLPVPVLTQKTWQKGAKNTRALPNTAATAIAKFNPIATVAGQKLAAQSNLYCTDIQVDEDGALMVVSKTWEYLPKNYPAIKAVALQ
jgi:hypothetical protein